MDPFFHSEKYFHADGDKDRKPSGSAKAVSLSGTDWLGIGRMAQGISHEKCGAKPICLWGDECSERKKAFERCVQSSLQVEVQKDKSKNKVIIWVVIAVSVVVLTAMVLLLRKRKKNK